MTGKVWIEFGTYLNTRGQFAARWHMQTQGNGCGYECVFEHREMLCGKLFVFQRRQTVTKLAAAEAVVPTPAQADGLCLVGKCSGGSLFSQ